MINLNLHLDTSDQVCPFRQQFISLLHKIGPGKMSNTAYDTAWIARLHQQPEMVPFALQAINWLRDEQLPDGSWGAKTPVYHHDRVICTLGALISLAEFGDSQDNQRIARGLEALSYHQQRLEDDLAGETIAFEMLTPTLLIEAVRLGLIKNKDTKKLRQYATAREEKLARSPGKMISRFITMAFSAEMAGSDGLHILDCENLQEVNGSIAHSPSATAYFLRFVDPHNQAAVDYLKRTVAEGGAPNVAPFDIFEAAWSLWNYAIMETNDPEINSICSQHINFLLSHWDPEVGIGHAAGYTPRDGDDTGFIFEVMSRFGRKLSINPILNYEEADHFQCFKIESNPSISTNIHIFGALKHAGLCLNHRSVNKVRQFLQANRKPAGFWVDKWHVSPYYTTSHLIITCAGYDDDLVQTAVDWIIQNQNEDGSWGAYGPTAEETAYCLQALVIWAKYGRFSHLTAIEKGVSWLEQHQDPKYPPLWIGKCLYAPENVIQSAILSAIMMSRSLLNKKD